MTVLAIVKPRSECPHEIAILSMLIHKLYSHVTLLGRTISARRAREVERAAQRQLAARATDVSSLGVVGDDPGRC
jgi:hypothetical protein